MIDSSVKQAVLHHWRTALMLSASVTLTACVAGPGGSSSSQTAESSSSVAVVSSSEAPSSTPQSSSSVAPISSSVAPSSSSMAPVSSSSTMVASSSAPACEEPDTTHFEAGKTAYNDGLCTACHGAPLNNGKTAGAAKDPIDATRTSFGGKTMAQYIIAEMTAYLPASCSGMQQQCAEDIEHYLKIATGAEAAPTAVCEESSSSVASSSSAPVVSSSSSAAPAGPSLLTSSGTFSNGKESFAPYVDNASYATYSFNGEANFAIDTATSADWHVQMTHPISVTAGVQYTICLDAKAASNRTIVVKIDNGPDQYADISGGAFNLPLTTSYQSFDSTFFADATDTTARLVINMGLDDADVQLDNIAVYEGDSCGGSTQPTSSSSSQASSQPVVSSSSTGSTSSNANGNSPAGVIFEDNFESYSANSLPTGSWSALNTSDLTRVSISGADSNSGSLSARVSSPGAFNPSFMELTLPAIAKTADHLYFRMFINASAGLGGDGGHAHMLELGDPSGQEVIRYGEASGSIGVNTLAGGDPLSPNPYVMPADNDMPAGSWHCLEVLFDKRPEYDELTTWVDGVVMHEISINKAAWGDQWTNNGPSKSWLENAFKSTVRFGWYAFNGVRGNTIFFDDVVISTEPVGCTYLPN